MLIAFCAIGGGALGPAQAAAGWHGLVNVTTAVGSPAVGAVNGIIYVAGGTTSSAPTAALQAYNPAKNTWSSSASLPETLYQADGAATINSGTVVSESWNACALPWKLVITLAGSFSSFWARWIASVA